MYKKTTLPNGLRVITSSMPHTRSVSVCFYIAVGSRYEDKKLGGVSHFVEHLLFKGTEKRKTAREISEAIESLGGILNGYTDKELTGYWCKVARPHFGVAFDVLSDMILNSKFEESEIEKERRVIIEEINMSYDDPPQVVSLLAEDMLWPNQPLGADIAGSKESVTGMSKADLLGYMKQTYQPSRTVISIAGNINHEEALEMVEKKMGAWQGEGELRSFLPPDAEAKCEEQIIMEKRKLEQSHICLIMPAVSVDDERRFALSILNIILGKGMSSRLFTEIRERLGLAYSVSSHVDTLLDTGSMLVYAGVDTANVKTTTDAICEQLKRFKEEPISEEELKKAKEFSKGRTLLRMEDTRGVAGWFGGQEALTSKILTVDDVVAKMEAVTVEDVSRVANELFKTELLRMAVVGPLRKKEFSSLKLEV